MIYPYVLEFTTCAVQGVTTIFSFFYPTGKAGGAQILRYHMFAVNYYGFTLGALALIPSDFCNDGVNFRKVSDAGAGVQRFNPQGIVSIKIGPCLPQGLVEFVVHGIEGFGAV